MIKKDQYAIVGLGVTQLGKVPGISARKFHAEACRLAIMDAGLKREDIGGYIYKPYASGPMEDAPPRMLGLPLDFYWVVDTGGPSTIAGICAAMGAIELGLANYVVVVCGGNNASVSKSPLKARRPYADMDKSVFSVYGTAGGAMRYAPIAQAHMARYGTTSRQLGAVAVAQRQYAAINPEAYFYGKPMTIEDHQNSKMVSDPLRLLDCALITDGGAALIVTTAERAKHLKHPPVYIKGVGMGNHMRMVAEGRQSETYFESGATVAKKQAFRMAGVDLKDIDVAQIYDAFTILVLVQFEDYGFCKRGEGGPFAEAGNMGPDAPIPINTSGGELSWAYLEGFSPMIEGIRQIRGACGPRQVKDAELCLVTAWGSYRPMSYGFGSPRVSSQACVILGREG